MHKCYNQIEPINCDTLETTNKIHDKCEKMGYKYWQQQCQPKIAKVTTLTLKTKNLLKIM